MGVQNSVYKNGHVLRNGNKTSTKMKSWKQSSIVYALVFEWGDKGSLRSMLSDLFSVEPKNLLEKPPAKTHL